MRCGWVLAGLWLWGVGLPAAGADEPGGADASGPADRLTVTAVGDVNMGTDFPSADYLPPAAAEPLFGAVAGLLTGDLVFGNLEGPLLDGGRTRKCGRGGNCYAFRTPTRYAEQLKEAGFTVMSLANNHALDFGPAGRRSTVAQLDRLDIAHSGKPGDVAELEVRGRKLALVAFATAGHSHNMLQIAEAAALVRRLDREHDLVLVSFHGGDEGSRARRTPDAPEKLGSEARGHVVQFAHAVVDAGADLVLGHGPHVLRGMEIYRDRLIAYSLGNFHTYGRFNLRGPLGRAVVLQVELDPASGAFRGGRLHATLQRRPGGARPDPAAGGIRDVRRLSRLDFPYTAPRIAADGALGRGPSPGAGLFTAATAEQRAAVAALIETLIERELPRARVVGAFGDARAALQPEVPERFARPAEKIYKYKEYRKIFIKPEVLERGRGFLQRRRALLDAIEQRYAVEREAVAGIIATETKFGSHRGKYRVFNALATQALEMKRRQRWATKELVALLRVFSDDPLAIKGSYAGAVGLVQFMPTSILGYGRDHDGDGRIDLDAWPDALASCANYLKQHGWRRGGELRRGRPNYRAFYRYNPSHHYARVVSELALAFGYGRPAAAADESGGQKPVAAEGAEPDPPATGAAE